MKSGLTTILNSPGDSGDGVNMFYDGPLNNWFRVPVGSIYTSAKPEFLSSAKGFRLKNRLVHAILYTRDKLNMKTTNADAIMTNFFLIPGGKRARSMLLKTGRPFIFPVHFRFIFLLGLSNLIKKLEISGAAGLFVAGWLPDEILKKLCKQASLPVISATAPRLDKIFSKIEAGAYAVCLPGKYVSKKMIRILHESYPFVPVIASCGRSEDSMLSCLKSGVDAVMYRPCVLFGSDREEYF